MNIDPIIITGARGRVGSVLASYFEARGHEVVRVSRTGGPSYLAMEDLFQSGLLRSTGTLIHCAWSTVPKTAEENPASIWTEDLPLLARLLSAVTSGSGSHRPSFVLFSTGGAVYGEGDPDAPKIETDPLSPIGWYGTGKMAAEELVGAFQRLTDLHAAILRVSNLYGFPYDPAKPQGFIAAAHHAARTGKVLKIWGDGTMRKDYLHLHDLCTAVERAVVAQIRGTFNICSGISRSVLEILELVQSVSGKTVSREHIAGPTWDVQCSVLSSKKFLAASGWKAAISVEDGIRLSQKGN